jgi:hypothetical protein
MPIRQVGPIQPGLSLDVNVMCQTVHVVAYRVWRKSGGGAWKIVGDGHTADDIPDHFAVPASAADTAIAVGDGLAYWLGIGGPANSPYEVFITIAQGGGVLPGGAIGVSGRVDANGVDVKRETDVVLV